MSQCDLRSVYVGRLHALLALRVYVTVNPAHLCLLLIHFPLSVSVVSALFLVWHSPSLYTSPIFFCLYSSPVYGTLPFTGFTSHPLKQDLHLTRICRAQRVQLHPPSLFRNLCCKMSVDLIFNLKSTDLCT